MPGQYRRQAGAPRHIELTGHRVLAQAGESRARHWLARAHAHLQATATPITDDALRAGFLANIPEHREIVAAWQLDLSDQ